MESLTWEAYPSSDIKTEDIEVFLNSKGHITKTEVYQFINTKGYFKPDVRHRSLKNHPKWTSFIKYASEWVEENNLMKKKTYDDYREEAVNVFKILREKVVERLLEGQNILFYGSFAMQTFILPTSEFLPLFLTKSENFASKIVTMDVDMAAENPKKACLEIFNYLTSAKVVHDSIFISEVKMVKKDDVLTSITLELRRKTPENPRGYVCLRSGMLDCTKLSNWNPKSYFSIKEGVWCQKPLHYLAGIIDKLYNSQLNERISKGHRKGAEDNAISKIVNLSIPRSLRDQNIEDIITSSPLLLSTFFLHPKQTRKSLNLLLAGKVDESIKTYLDWKSAR